MVSAVVSVGTVGLALPWWLHRFARQTDEKQLFPSLMFLEASTVRRSRRHQLKYWLLLALRVGLLAALALAFAGPLWQRSVTAGATGQRSLHVVVVDSSMSMQLPGRFDAAKARAREVLNSVRGRDRLMLVAADHRLRVMQAPAFVAQRGVALAALDALAPGHSRLDYGAMMSGASAWTPAPDERVQLHVITDLQASAGPLRFADLQPPPGAQLNLVDVGSGAATNLRVTSAILDPRDDGQINVRLEGDAAARSGRSVVLTVNGVERARRTLSATEGAGERAYLDAIERFEVGTLGEGEHRVTASLVPADALPQDDAFHALVRHVRPKLMLVAANVAGDDAVYLRAALESLESPTFDVQLAAPGAVATRSLSEFAAIIVSDAGVLTDAGVTALRKYLTEGGAALLTLGPRTAQRGSEAVSGAQLASGRARNAANAQQRAAEVEQSHPVLREPGLWRGIRFFRHVPVVAPEGARTLIEFENGSPLLVEQRVERGKLLLLASPLSREWNDLAIHPLFVRFIAESAVYLAGARSEAATALIGSAIDTDLAGRGGGQVFDPQGKRATMLGSGEATRLVPDQPGFYEVRGGGRSDFIAVNTDPRESALAGLAPESVERWRALAGAATSASATVGAGSAGSTPAGPTPAAAAGPTQTIPIWFWLLLAAAVLAFLEPLVANLHLNIQRERQA